MIDYGNDIFMNKWLKKHFAEQKNISSSSQNKFLRNPNLWRINRHSVAAGIAVGLFVAMIPILPFQSLLALLLAIILRANLPIAFLASWVSNPLTLLPLAYFTYYLGASILNEKNLHRISLKEINWNFANFHEIWSSLSAWFLQFGKAFFVGLPIVALTAALIGYLIVIIIWRKNK